MSGWWLEAGLNPTVGWREDADDPMPAALEAAGEIGQPVTIHEPECERGKVGGERCSCQARVVGLPRTRPSTTRCSS